MLMLRKSIPIFKIGVVITAAGVALYFYNDNYGKYVLGAGLMIISVAMVFYILFMFKRYGERKKN